MVEAAHRLPNVPPGNVNVQAPLPAAPSRPMKLPRPAGRPAKFPLSFAQERLWVLHQLDPHSVAYNIPRALRLKGTLNFEALQGALNAIVQRHESLRTTFASEAGEPVQIVAEARPVLVQRVDLKSLPAQERERESLRHATQEAQTPFDLANGPLVRVVLFEFGPEDHLLLINVHHVAYDGWSDNIFRRELAGFYQAFLEGAPAPFAELPIQCGDFAVWQRERLRGEMLTRQLEYWQRQLAGAPTVLELPTDRARPVRRSLRGATHRFLVPGNVVAALRQLSRAQGATLFITLMAAFESLLHRYTGQEDLLLGFPTAGRDLVETEGLIGFFVNTLVSRADFSNDPTFDELLRRTRESAFGAYANQDLPFERLVEALNPARSLGHGPLVQAMFVLHTQADASCQFPGLTLSLAEIDTQATQFDLTMQLVPEAGALCGALEYSSELFDAPTIARMALQFQTLLESVVANPRQRISELPMITPLERRRLLVEWNQTATIYPREACIQELFEAQVERSPDDTAVVFGGKAATYGELNARANQLARHLAQFRVQPDQPVALCVEPSLELVIGLLGILKAGGAYVPLDAAYPSERLAFMLDDTKAPVLLTQQHLLSQLPQDRCKVFCLDAAWDLVAREDSHNPAKASTPESLAYVMYTSGSTGQPKGVAVPHRAVIRLVRDTNYLQLDATDRIPQLSNISFDAATFEVWGALLNGGQLIGITKDVALSPRDFARELREQRITALFLTTALFNQIATDAPAAFSTVRTVMFGGEAVDPKSVRAVLQQGPPRRLLHVYGPTENTTFSTWHLVEGVSEGAATVPIGRPIANSRLYILDQHLRPVPVGVPGELYTGGDGLAHGYWRRPELTAERFVPNPFFEAGAVERLYKTGDRARYLPDGSVEFLGRIDQQVKIRGFRVELGEIESVLSRHPGVRDCAVALRVQGAANKRLVAYFVANGDGAPSGAELRGFLKEQLPDYMLPSAWVRLEKLPLTANGKANRQALPAPENWGGGSGTEFVSPRTPMESAVAAVWAEELELKEVGVHDNFFDLGGNSLLAVRLVLRLEERFGRKLPVAALFTAPTVAQLAQAILPSTNSVVAPRLCTLQAGEGRPPFFFLGELAFLRLIRLPAGQSFHVLRTRGVTDSPAFTTVSQLAADHLAVVRSVQPEGPYVLGGYCFDGVVAFEMAAQLQAQGQEVKLVIAVETYPGETGVVRLTRRLTNGVGAMLHWEDAQTVRRAWPWINRMTRLQIWARLPAGERTRVARAFLQRKARDWRRQGSPETQSGPTLSPPANHAPDYLDTRVIELGGVMPNELLIKRGYVIPRFTGPVGVFMCEQAVTRFRNLGRSWLRTAPQAQIEIVPGDHQTCLTDHAVTLASKVQARIESALAGGELSPASVHRAPIRMSPDPRPQNS